ncbi:MAG: hypothetical protein WEC80_00815, partial [Patescibacteria group bacterium]
MLKLLSNLFNRSGIKKNNFLGLLLKENEGIVYIIGVEDSNPSIIVKERFNYTNGWDNLLEDIDEVLYRLELKGFKSPDSCIFFVYSNLVDKYKKEIKKEYLIKVKQLVKNLELKPLGYIEVHDAVIDLVSSKEGIPLSSILIEVDNKSLTVFLYKNGKLIYIDQVEKKENIMESLMPTFDKLKVDNILPSRILIYDSKNVEREVSSIISHSWDKEIFIQHPKVEIVNEIELTNSLINVFSKQLNADIPSVVKEQSSKEVMGFSIGQDQAPMAKIERNFTDRPKELFSTYLSKVSSFYKIFAERLKNFKYSRSIIIFFGLFIIILAFLAIEFFF